MPQNRPLKTLYVDSSMRFSDAQRIELTLTHIKSIHVPQITFRAAVAALTQRTATAAATQTAAGPISPANTSASTCKPSSMLRNENLPNGTSGLGVHGFAEMRLWVLHKMNEPTGGKTSASTFPTGHRRFPANALQCM